MTKNIKKKTKKEITITHKIKVDQCIADEILELNNKHNILTILSCCGHGDEKEAFLLVHDDDIGKIIKLGYEIASEMIYAERAQIQCQTKDEIKLSVRWSLGFRPKSICQCKKVGPGIRKEKNRKKVKIYTMD